MRMTTAAAGSAAFAVVAPGVVAGLVPWLLTDWQAGASGYPGSARACGALLTAAGAAVVLVAFGQFVVEGRGTPAPPAPTERLVVRGMYRYVRNPMYLAVLAVICGQGLLLGRPVLFGYGAVVAVLFGSFVRWYEQPSLRRRFGSQYENYLREVPGWLPRRPAARTGKHH